MKRVAVLLLALVGVAACGDKGPSSTDDAEKPGHSKLVDPPVQAEPQRVQIPDTKVPLFVEVQPIDNKVDADLDSSGTVQCEVSLSWEDGKNATDEAAPWTGSLPIGEPTEVTFHLVVPVTKVNFEYVVARVTPRLITRGGIRFDIETTCYACIR